MKIKNFQKNKGFSLVEVLIACAIISICIFTLMESASRSIKISKQSLQQVQASFLLEEGAEAVKAIRNANWTTISNLNLDQNYYLSYDTGANLWSLNQTPAVIDSIFTRTIVLSAVNRDAEDDISQSGTLDPRTKKVVVNVSWPSSGGESVSKDLSFYISDIFN